MKVNNYGDVGEFFLKKKLIAYVEFGSYQGEYIAVYEDDEDLNFYKGYYGSCSGCDWIEAEKDWSTEEISEDKVLEFANKEFTHSFATIPKETILRVDTDTFTSFLPANVRSEIYDFDGSELYMEIKKNLIANKSV